MALARRIQVRPMLQEGLQCEDRGNMRWALVSSSFRFLEIVITLFGENSVIETEYVKFALIPWGGMCVG